MGNSCGRCFKGEARDGTEAYRLHENTHHLGISGLGNGLDGNFLGDGALRTDRVAIAPTKLAKFEYHPPPPGEDLSAVDFIAWMRPDVVQSSPLKHVQIVKNNLPATVADAPHKLVLSGPVAPESPCQDPISHVLGCPPWSGATSWLLIPFLCQDRLPGGTQGVKRVVDAVTQAAQDEGTPLRRTAGVRAAAAISHSPSAAFSVDEKRVRTLLKVLLDAMMDPDLLMPEKGSGVQLRHPFGDRPQAWDSIRALYRTQVLRGARTLLSAANLQMCGASFVQDAVISVVSVLSAGDALWILEGLLQNPQLIDALGGEPDGAGQMPPGVKVFEIVVAHALEAWQGHKSQGQAYLSWEATEVVRHVLNNTSLPNAMGSHGVLGIARTWLRGIAGKALSDGASAEGDEFSRSLCMDWGPQMLICLVGALLSSQGILAVLGNHGVSQTIDMVLSFSFSAPDASPAPSPPLPASPAVSPRWSPRRSHRGSARSNSATRGEGRGRTTPRGRWGRRRDEGQVGEAEGREGREGESVAGADRRLLGGGLGSSTTALQIVLSMLEGDQGLPSAIILRCLLELVRRDSLEAPAAASPSMPRSATPRRHSPPAGADVPARERRSTRGADGETSGDESSAGDSRASIDNTEVPGLGRAGARGAPLQPALLPGKFPLCQANPPVFALAMRGLGCREAVRRLDPEDVKQVRNAVMARARLADAASASVREGQALERPDGDSEASSQWQRAGAVGALCHLLESACSEGKLSPSDARTTLRQMIGLATAGGDPWGAALAVWGIRRFLSWADHGDRAQASRNAAVLPTETRAALSMLIDLSAAGVAAVGLASRGAVAVLEGAELQGDAPRALRAVLRQCVQAVVENGDIDLGAVAGVLGRVAAQVGARGGASVSGVRRAGEWAGREERTALDTALRSLRDRLVAPGDASERSRALAGLQTLLSCPMICAMAVPATLSLSLTAVVTSGSELDPHRATALLRAALRNPAIAQRASSFLDPTFSSKLLRLLLALCVQAEAAGEAPAALTPPPNCHCVPQVPQKQRDRPVPRALPSPVLPSRLPLHELHEFLSEGPLDDAAPLPAPRGSDLTDAIDLVSETLSARGSESGGAEAGEDGAALAAPVTMELLWSKKRSVTMETGSALAERFTETIVSAPPHATALLARVLARNAALRLRFTPAQVQAVCQRLVDAFVATVGLPESECDVLATFDCSFSPLSPSPPPSPTRCPPRCPGGLSRDLLLAIQAVAVEQEGGSMLGRLTPAQAQGLWRSLEETAGKVDGPRKAGVIRTLGAMARCRDVVRQVAPAIAGLAESALLILGRATDGSDMQVAEEETFAEVARAATNPLARSISAQSADARHLHGSLSLVRSPSRLSRVSGPGSPGPTTSAGCPVLQLAARDVVLALLSAGEPAALSALGDGIAAVMIHAVLFPRVPPGGKQEAAAKERAWPDERAAESLAAVLLQPTTQDWLGTAGRRAVLAALARHAAAVPTCVPTGPVHPAGCVVLGMLFARDGFWRSEEGPETHEIHSAAGPPLDLLHLCAMSHIPALRPLALDACKALSEGVSGDAGAQAETSAAPQPSPRRISGPSVGLQRASAAASRLAMRVASLRGDSPSGGYVHRLQVLLWHQTLASLVGEGPFPDSIEGGSVNGSSAPGSTLLPSAILLGGEWAAPADIVAAAHAREVSEALGRVLGRLPQPQRVLDDVRSCLVPGMVVVPLQSDPAGLGSSPVALSQQVHLAESYAQLILTGSANALDKGEAKAKRGSGSGFRQCSSYLEAQDFAAQLAWLLSCSLELVAPLGSPLTQPATKALVLSLSDASLCRCIDAIWATFNQFRSSDTGAAWELLATPLSALATSLCYSHLGSKSRALTQLATAIAEIVSEASSKSDAGMAMCADILIRALSKSPSGCFTLLKVLASVKTVAARVRLLMLVAESGFASVVQVPGAGATVLAAMKNCLPKTGRLRMWTGRMMGDSSEDLSVSKAGPARSLLPQLSGDRLDQAAEDSLKNLGEMAIPSDGLSKTFGPPSRPSSPPAQGVARSPSSSALPVRVASPAPVSGTHTRIPSAFEGAGEVQGRMGTGSGELEMLEMHLKDELFRRAFPQVDVPLDSPTTSQVENVVGGSNTEGAGRGVDGLEGVMAGVRMLCQMACYSAGPVSQGALLALTKVLAGHVGHSGRALATQRLFWLVAQGRLSLAALRTLELHKSIREMVSDKLFVAHKSTACLAAIVAGGSAVLSQLDGKATAHDRPSSNGGAAAREGTENDASAQDGPSDAGGEGAGKAGHFGALKSLIAVACAKGGGALLPSAMTAAVLVGRAGEAVLAEGNMRMGPGWMGALFAQGLGSWQTEPLRALLALQMLSLLPPRKDGAVTASLQGYSGTLASRLDAILGAARKHSVNGRSQALPTQEDATLCALGDAAWRASVALLTMFPGESVPNAMDRSSHVSADETTRRKSTQWPLHWRVLDATDV